MEDYYKNIEQNLHFCFGVRKGETNKLGNVFMKGRTIRIDKKNSLFYFTEDNENFQPDKNKPIEVNDFDNNFESYKRIALLLGVSIMTVGTIAFIFVKCLKFTNDF